jgi:hypothetical protein
MIMENAALVKQCRLFMPLFYKYAGNIFYRKFLCILFKLKSIRVCVSAGLNGVIVLSLHSITVLTAAQSSQHPQSSQHHSPNSTPVHTALVLIYG